MSTYFHGGRRKIGLLTLVLACVLMGVWIRSLCLLDYVEFPVGKHTSVFIVTYSPFFALFIEHDPEINLPPASAKWMSQSTAKLAPEDFAGMNYSSLHSMIKYRNHPPVVPKGPGQPIRVPKLSQGYWLIGLPVTYLFAIPPTLLAAYLLISKRRQPNSESGQHQDSNLGPSQPTTTNEWIDSGGLRKAGGPPATQPQSESEQSPDSI